jgi:Four helix bundle sensory module for signal transduction
VKTVHAKHSKRNLRFAAAIGVALVLSLIVGLGVFLWRNANPQWVAFERSVKELQLLQTMSRELLASAEAEKSAVMADTDEASQAFAEQSKQASRNVEEARRALEPLLEGNRIKLQQFDEFTQCWEKLQEIDKEILSLAVQNTNLKALRISFGPAAGARRRMEQHLTQLMDVVRPTPDAVVLTRLASQALVGTLNIYALHAPHIAENNPMRMEEMEGQMRQFDAQVTQAFQHLQGQVGELGQQLLDGAWVSYKEFHQLTEHIITLSRNNSNIHSFAISLGQKRNMTATCQETLTALQETVHQGMSYKATR